MKKIYHVVLFVVLVALGTIGTLYAVSMFQVQKKWETEQYSEADASSLQRQERLSGEDSKALAGGIEKGAVVLPGQSGEEENGTRAAEAGVGGSDAAGEGMDGSEGQETGVPVFLGPFQKAAPASRMEEKTGASTAYCLWEYDAFTNTTRLKTLKLPEEWVGLTREELCNRVREALLHPSLEEMEKGLTDFEVVGFSADKVKLKKTYDERTVACRFYGMEKDGMVVIYHMDRETVYEYTGIRCDALDEEEQEKLKEGIPIQDEEQLYGLLQAYSS